MQIKCTLIDIFLLLRRRTARTGARRVLIQRVEQKVVNIRPARGDGFGKRVVTLFQDLGGVYSRKPINVFAVRPKFASRTQIKKGNLNVLQYVKFHAGLPTTAHWEKRRYHCSTHAY